MKKLSVKQLKEMVKSELSVVKEQRIGFFEQLLDLLEKIENTPRAPSEVRNSASVLKAYMDRGLTGRLEEKKKP